MADIDPAFVQQIFDIPKRERKPNLQHHRWADDLGTGFKVLNEKGLVIPTRHATTPPRSSKVILTRSSQEIAIHLARFDTANKLN